MSEKILLQNLASLIGKEADLSTTEAEAFVRTFFDTILSVVEKEGSVKIKGLGTFKLVEVDSRESVDVNTGGRIRIGSHNKLSFTPETALKKRVNKPFESFDAVVLNEDVDIACMESLDNEVVAQKKKEYVEEHAEVSEHSEVSEKAEVSDHSEVSEKSKISENSECSENSEISEHSETPENAEHSEPSQPTRIEHIIPPLKMQLEISKEQQTEAHKEETPTVELAKEKTENRWLKVSLLLLLAVLLCVSSYFAGYYKVLCPDCEESLQSQKKPAVAERRDTVVRRTTKPVVKVVAPKPIASKDSAKTKVEKTSSVKLNPARSYRMTGDMATHTLKAGENIYRVARHYYGDKDFARYIIRYNKLNNPDVIHVGTRLRIPKLEE